MTKHPCPSCGFLVFEEPAGSYDYCPICNWEDDSVQLRYPSSPVGANHGSLLDYQTKILEQIPPEIKEYGGFTRDSTWRPLRQEDLDMTYNPKSSLEYFESTKLETPEYYWKR